jgi:hypothetical protein
MLMSMLLVEVPDDPWLGLEVLAYKRTVAGTTTVGIGEGGITAGAVKIGSGDVGWREMSSSENKLEVGGTYCLQEGR